jgi:hypothetical protein
MENYLRWEIRMEGYTDILNPSLGLVQQGLHYKLELAELQKVHLGEAG